MTLDDDTVPYMPGLTKTARSCRLTAPKKEGLIKVRHLQILVQAVKHVQNGDVPSLHLDPLEHEASVTDFSGQICIDVQSCELADHAGVIPQTRLLLLFVCLLPLSTHG
jgi:hypothetical protein